MRKDWFPMGWKVHWGLQGSIRLIKVNRNRLLRRLIEKELFKIPNKPSTSDHQPLRKHFPLKLNKSIFLTTYTCCSNSKELHSHVSLFVCLIRKWCRMCLHCGGFSIRFSIYFQVCFVSLALLGINFPTPFRALRTFYDRTRSSVGDVCVCQVNRWRGLGVFYHCQTLKNRCQ